MLQFHVATMVDNEIPGLPKVILLLSTCTVIYQIVLGDGCLSLFTCNNDN